uniref:Diacylglycerol O-acyltransferase 3, cytosolic-like n=1 Tax=Nelumbo nucifera TaxID=4432 RepID=A0A822YWI7_NELNU|nr:TPA_asm: hypothetical protein HUJ06_009105 [Nelumbo nucifera]
MKEAAEVLLAQLQQLRAKEKEMKKKRKQEKARLKATQMKTKTRAQCESSGSSSESSDIECGEVVSMKMSRLRDRALVETKLDASKQDTSAVLTTPSLLIQENRAEGIEKIEDCSIQTCSRQGCCNQKDSGGCSKVSSNDYRRSKPVVVGEASTERIEVCMGGKCKKMGAEMLLEEFGKRVGVEGVVVGCKCMGKCREGPNIRVFNQLGTEEVDDGRPSNPLCIGVGLEDVGMVVANFFGEERKDLGLATRM